MRERLCLDPIAALRRFPWPVLVLVGVSYLRGGTFWHVFAVAMIALTFVLWLAFMPRVLVVDADGLALHRIATRTLRARWADIARFEVYVTPAAFAPTYASWYLTQSRGRWWKRSAPDGSILPVLVAPGGGAVLSPEELVAWLDDRLAAATGRTREDRIALDAQVALAMPEPGMLGQWFLKRQLRKEGVDYDRNGVRAQLEAAARGEIQRLSPEEKAALARGLADKIIARADGVTLAEAEEMLLLPEVRDLLRDGRIEPDAVLRDLRARAERDVESRPAEPQDDPFKSGKL